MRASRPTSSTRRAAGRRRLLGPVVRACKAVTRALEELAGETDRIEFVKFDIDANPIVASRYDVLSIPTVILFAAASPAKP